VLLAVPNFSEGRDRSTLDALAAAFGPDLIHSSADPDHHRSVYTAGGDDLPDRIVAAARVAVERIDLSRHDGIHPRVGAIDVAPIVYFEDAERGRACAEALILADRLGHELELPVFLYGALAGGRTRAELRRGGPNELQRRIDAGELIPDAGPRRLHPTAGAVLVAARPPLAAFNLAVDATLDQAKRIAASIREGGPEGLAGVRALGLGLERAGLVQVSTNIEDLTATTPAQVVAAVQRHAPVTAAELIAPAPRSAFESFPAQIPLAGAPLLG
jgi:glutamate formiminotransferase / 5-formyltetrahydrofolate cyclo-ligase